MNRSLRIVVGEDEADMRAYYRESLANMGHQLVALAGTGQELLEHCRTVLPDLVLTDIVMPDRDGFEVVNHINRHRPVPVIIVSAHHDDGLVARADHPYILAYLVKPVKPIDLSIAIHLAARRSEQIHTLQQEAASLRQTLEDRKIIERAKGILMKRTGLDEPQAFRRLQKIASEKNCKLVEIARSILVAEEVSFGTS